MAITPQLIIKNTADVTIVDLRDVRLREADEISAVGEELYRLVDEQGCRKLLLECTRVRFLASAALGLLSELRKKLLAHDGRLVICGLRKELKKVFDIMRITKLFTFCADERASLEALGVQT